MKSQIRLHGIQMHCIVGLLPMERIHKQNLILNLDISLDYKKSAQQDVLDSDTVDYSLLATQMEILVQTFKFQTLESLVWHLVDFIFQNFPVSAEVQLEAIKPTAVPNCPKAALFLAISKGEWQDSSFTALYDTNSIFSA